MLHRMHPSVQFTLLKAGSIAGGIQKGKIVPSGAEGTELHVLHLAAVAGCMKKRTQLALRVVEQGMSDGRTWKGAIAMPVRVGQASIQPTSGS